MKNFNIVFVIVVIITVGGLLFVISKSGEESKSDPTLLDNFAQCLADKEITMYGAEWCPHCKNEKKRFGESFKYVPYVECPDNPQMCVDKGIDGYPTWLFPDGKKLEGEQGLEKLAKESGCELPQNGQ